MGWIIVSILLVILLGVAIYVIRNLLRQVEQLEERDEQFANWFLNFKKDIDLASTQLKNIDHKGSFEADDEIGFIFKEIKKIQGRLNEYFD
jgi:predicted PurR-regulated permease PerM